MYKQIVIPLFNFIIHPEKAWKECNEEQDSDNEIFLKSYLYPVFGLIALFSFVGILLYLKKLDMQIAIKQVVKETIPYFAGFYISVFALSRWSLKFFEMKLPNPVCERFTGYASSAVYVMAMLYALFPYSLYIHILNIYTFYIVRQGAIHYIQINTKYLTKFTIFAGVLIAFTPVIIRLLLILMMQGANKFGL
jgi:hypothetical protein